MVDIYKPIELLVPEEEKLKSINLLEYDLYSRFSNVIKVDPSVNRKLVSFQANKQKPLFRWYKFKEAFSSELIESLFSRYGIKSGTILDPFAGSGTSLFTASTLGINADGIELLPLAQELIQDRLLSQYLLSDEEIKFIANWIEKKEWEKTSFTKAIPTLRITEKAYPAENQLLIEKYLYLIQQLPKNIYNILFLALLCVLENVSYTRKDGQYLRWDSRAKRANQTKRTFTKTSILDFSPAIYSKVKEIITDTQNLRNQNKKTTEGLVRLFRGSNLNLLPELKANSYSAIITSPPYCNRYDYTRTYALELALLGLNDDDVISLRQQMMSSTVENRQKDLLGINKHWEDALGAVNNQIFLQTILIYLEEQRIIGNLNNSGIPRMVRGYFEEMSCIIYECFRVLKPGGLMFMVNDNVRFAGISIPVDLLLSDIAQTLGFSIESILVLPEKQGNSSQQMGKHGKDSLRKCIYVWRKP